MNKRILSIPIVIIALGAVVFRAQVRDAYIEWSKPLVPSEQPRTTLTPQPSAGTSPRSTVRPSDTPKPTAVSGAVNLAVPFQAQAPRGDWSEPWQNACEEASSILVDSFWKNETLSVDEMAQRILTSVAWENTHFGYYQETTSAQVAQMLREAHGYKRVDVKYDATLADIMENVRAGRPVIVPLAGRLLGNPNYVAPGPIYHMLVVKGVTESGDIITNDVGTRHGHNYVYAPAVFLNAMHDAPAGGAGWPENVDPAEYIKTGRRAIVVVYPN